MTRTATFLLSAYALFAPTDAGWAQQQGAWTAAQPMPTAREYGALVAIGGGRVLAIGGADTTGAPLASAEIYSPATGAWTPTGAMSGARESFAAATLANGKVLVAGGVGVGDAPLASAEIFDPTTGAWTAAGTLPAPAFGLTATVLSNGTALVAGGCSGSPCTPSTSAEIYDPAKNAWTATGALVTGRYFQTAVRLPTGKALLVGGLGAGGALSSSELYDPKTGAWSAAANLKVARYQNATTVLRDGKVLVTGGAAGRYPLRSAEIYDPVANTWTLTGSMKTARYAHSATLLGDGTVVVAGGEGQSISCGKACTGYIPTGAAEIYSEATGAFASTSPLPRAIANQSAVAMPSGRALLAGGTGTTATCCIVLNAAEYYVPLSLTLTPSAMNFGLMKIGLTSRPIALTASNVSPHAVAFSGITITGDYVESSACPATLAAGQTCQVSVSFAPKAAGQRNGVLTFADNSPGSPRQTIPLSGVGAALSLAFTPSSAPLGSVVPGSSSTTIVSLTNDGASTVGLGAVAVAPTGVFSQSHNCPATLGVQQSCTFTLTFIPPDVGTYTATLSVANGAGAAAKLPMIGVGLDN